MNVIRLYQKMWIGFLLVSSLPLNLCAANNALRSPPPEENLIEQVTVIEANNLSQIDFPRWLHKVDGILSGTLTVQPSEPWVIPAIYTSLVTGAILLAWSVIWFIVGAFRIRIYWGTALLIPVINLFAAPAFIIRHWNVARSALSMAAISAFPLFLLPLGLCGTMIPVAANPMVLPLNRIPMDLLVKLLANNQTFTELEADYNSLLTRAEQLSSALPIEKEQYLIDKKRYVENAQKAQNEKDALESALRQLGIRPEPLSNRTPPPTR